MVNVTGKFVPDPYPRAPKSRGETRAIGREMAVGPGTTTGRNVALKGHVGSLIRASTLDGLVSITGVKPAVGSPVVDPKAARAARDKRIDELMTVVEALHDHTLAELAK